MGLWRHESFESSGHSNACKIGSGQLVPDAPLETTRISARLEMPDGFTARLVTPCSMHAGGLSCRG
jgi:hypothetical protein